MRWQTPCNSTFVVAPTAFRGDWSGLIDSGTLSYDMTLIDTPQPSTVLPYEVQVSGPGGSLVWTSPGSSVPTPWIRHTIGIDEGSWTLNSGSFAGTLADVTELKIRVRMFTNNETAIRIGIDNVVLTPVPEPASLAVLAVGGLALLQRKRKA
jgi:hypothetical protein